MSQFKSSFLNSLLEKKYIQQITHEKELDELMAKEKIAAYIGFDCTAKSLHVGSLLQIMVLRELQKHGHQPIVLLGGGTTKIGDPSGKDEARQVLGTEKIVENLEGIRKTLSKFDLSKDNPTLPKFQFVNNDEWLSKLNYIEFLSDIGRHFSVNKMLTFDSVKMRLERDQPLSFLEFNYMILQAYDFYELNKKYSCRLQIGGSDQWGNIVNGVELTRKIAASNNEKIPLREVFGLTTPLLTTSDGKKMGKTADGAVWLDESMLSPFDYFQYFRNVNDADVARFLRFFTEFSEKEIAEIEKLNINEAKEKLAFEATKICYNEKIAFEVLEKARAIFSAKNSDAFEKKTFEIGKKITDIIFESGAVESKGDAKRMLKGGAVKLNGEKIDDENLVFDKKGEFDLSVGKKKFFRIIIK